MVRKRIELLLNQNCYYKKTMLWLEKIWLVFSMVFKIIANVADMICCGCEEIQAFSLDFSKTTEQQTRKETFA